MGNRNYISADEIKRAGFTLVELMIVVVIVAILASVAVVAYQKHIKSGRLVGAREFVSRIQGRQESYFQQFGHYINVSTASTFYPTLTTPEPKAKQWASPPTTWVQLGARPAENGTYFSYFVGASAGPTHALDAIATTLGIPAQPGGGMTPHPWYYVVGHGDLDGDATYANGGCSGATILAPTNCTVLTTTSAQSTIVVRNEGE